MVFFAGIDNSVRALNLKTNQLEFALYGHTDTVTDLSLSNSGDHLLSNAMDSTVRMWDIRPYSEVPGRQVRVFTGASHNFEKNLLRCCWSGDDKLVSAGSADRQCYIWNSETGELRHRLGGHQGSVNATSLNKNGTLVASASSDKSVILGELSAE